MKKAILLSLLAILIISCNFPLLRSSSSPASSKTTFTEDEYKYVIQGLFEKYDYHTNEIGEHKLTQVLEYDNLTLQRQIMDHYDQQVMVADQMAYQPPPGGYENVQLYLKKLAEELKVIRKLEGDYMLYRTNQRLGKLQDHYEREAYYYHTAKKWLGVE